MLFRKGHDNFFETQNSLPKIRRLLHCQELFRDDYFTMLLNTFSLTVIGYSLRIFSFHFFSR